MRIRTPEIIPVMHAGASMNALSWEVLEGVPAVTVEQKLEGSLGRIQISRSRQSIERNVPQGRQKSAVSLFLNAHFESFHNFMACISTTGTDATRFLHGELLSSDFHVFTPYQMYSHEVAVNLMRVGPAPFMVAEIEWDTETDWVGRGFSKVYEDLFPATGINDTRIQEVWLVVLSKKQFDCSSQRTPCKLHWIWIAGPVITFVAELVLSVLFYKVRYSLHSDWNGLRGLLYTLRAVLARELVRILYNTPQEVTVRPQNTPYLAICIRGQPVRYFELKRNHMLILPRQCLHWSAMPIAINDIYGKLR